MNIFQEWMDRVSARVIVKGHVQQVYQHIYPKATDIGWVGGKRTSLTVTEASCIVGALEARLDGGPLVTEAQWRQGADWLVRYGKRLGLPEAIVGKEPAEFRFPRCESRQGPVGRGYNSEFWLPVYVAYYLDGSTLTYSTGSWQSQTAAIEFTYKEAA